MFRQKRHLNIFIYLALSFVTQLSYSQDTLITNSEDTVILSQEDMNFNMILAADSGNHTAVLEWLKKGADPDAKTWDGVPALYYAAQNGHYETVRVLVANGANINNSNSESETPLIIATKTNNEDIALYLLNKKALTSLSGQSGLGPLHYAVAYNYYIMTDMLLFFKADPEIKTIDGLTPLMLAAFYDYPEIADLLISKGANVNAKDNYGFTPLMLASQNGNLQMAEFLISKGADINQINNRDDNALILAIKNDRSEMVSLLIKNNADLKEKSETDPLKTAICYNRKEIADTLIKHGVRARYTPYFNKFFFSYNINFNNKDLMFEEKFGMIESRYKLGIDIGIANHYWAKRVLVKKEETIYDQLWERRAMLFTDIDKRFSLKSTTKSDQGFFIGVRGLYTYGSYRGIKTKVDDGFKLAPQIGLYSYSKSFAFKLNYEYVDFKVIGIPDHRISLSLLFFIFSTDGISDSNKDIYYFN